MLIGSNLFLTSRSYLSDLQYRWSVFINKLIGVLLFGWLHLVFSPGALSYCIDRWACFSFEQHNDGVDVFLENKKAYVITATLQIQTRNLQTSAEFSNQHEVTKVLTGYQKQKVLSLKQFDRTQSFHYDDSQFNWTPGNMHAEHWDEYLYAKPYNPDQHYRVIQGFGGGWSHRGPSKYAVDFGMPVGTPVHAARNGVVIDITERHNRGGAERRFGKYANFITILHDDDTTGEYYHLKQYGAAVDIGQHVKRGELIGYSGNTGFSSMPHLHFAVYRARSHGNFESIPIKFAVPIKRARWQQEKKTSD